MKEWLNSFTPWRWIFPLVIYLCMALIVSIGFEAEAIDQGGYFVGPQWLWYIGLLIYILLNDYYIGFGRRGNFLRTK